MQTERKNITAPADHWQAWATAAQAAGMTLSEWVGRQCNRTLGKAAAKLSDRRPAHRPKKE